MPLQGSRTLCIANLDLVSSIKKLSRLEPALASSTRTASSFSSLLHYLAYL